jgi:F420-0:gamma-glutamyl ligase
MGKAGEGLPVVVIQFAKVKIFRGNGIWKLWVICYVLIYVQAY